jgi:hypothetical protein
VYMGVRFASGRDGCSRSTAAKPKTSIFIAAKLRWLFSHWIIAFAYGSGSVVEIP